MKYRQLHSLIAVLVFGLATCTTGDSTSKLETDARVPYDHATAFNFMKIPFLSITGDSSELAAFEGKVMLVVNVASNCGYTNQYAKLEELYRTYRDSGLVVLGFPANNFGNQEPGSNEEILDFCQTRFNVSFPMMGKISVKGKDKHPLFIYFTEDSNLPGEINWNFSKLLLDRSGQLVARFDSQVQPMSAELVEQIEKLL